MTRLLTKRQAEVLRVMRDKEEELAYERGQAWVGDEKTSGRTVFALLRCMAISPDTFFDKADGYTLYAINSTGRQLLEEYDKEVSLLKNRNKNFAALARKRNEDIDTSDIPEVKDWSGAVVGKFYRPGARRVDANKPQK